METLLDPRKVLELPNNYDIDILRKQFKKKVMMTHPDMTSSQIASTENFQILSTCYKILLKELELKEIDKSFETLKKESHNYHKETPNFVNRNLTPDKFNTDKFNQLFEDTKIKDPYERGYENWIKKNRDASNNVSKDVIKYVEPTGGVCSTLDGYLLGVNKIDDFSANNMNDKDLNYMDYRIAYTTPTIEHELKTNNIIVRDDFKSFDDLKQKRSAINFTMDTDTLMKVALERKKTEENEKKRLENIQIRDKKIAENHFQNNGLFLDLLKKY